MANKTIPQLPEQTGKTDNDLLAIVDSGETTTSKIKLSTLLDGVGGAFQTGDATDSIVPAYSPTSRGVTANTTYVDKLNVNLSNALDIDNSTTNSYVAIGGYGTRTISSANLGSAFVGGRNMSIGGNANFSAGQFGSSIAGENNGMVGGRGNAITGGEYCFIGGGRSCVTSSFYSGILGGQNNSVTGTYSAVIAGRDCSNAGKDSTILSSEFANITGNATIIGGWGSYVYPNTPNPENGAFSFYSPGSYVRQTNGSGTGAIKGDLQGLIASKTCEINGQTGNETTRSLIIASNDTDITGGTTNTLMLGCSGRTALNSYTTYVETLEAFTHVVLNDYSNLNFASDSAAATGGVPLGGLYHNAGDLKVRIT